MCSVSILIVSGVASGRFLRTAGVISVPFACTTLMLFVLMASLFSCASYLGCFPTHSIIFLKLFFLTVLESGMPLSSRGLEEAL